MYINKLEIPEYWPSDFHEFSISSVATKDETIVFNFTSDEYGAATLYFGKVSLIDKKFNLSSLRSCDQIEFEIISFIGKDGSYKLLYEECDFSVKPVIRTTKILEFSGEIVTVDITDVISGK
jgi:hypothetical protein